MTMMLTTPTARRLDAGLAILRLVVGGVFIAHGAQKLFVFGLGGATGAFTQMGVPLPAVTAPLVAFVEFFGGIALVLGLLTRLAALGVATIMLGVILLVKSGAGFFAPRGFEFELTLLGGALALALAGAGDFSIDRRIAARRAAR
jgi:putative oxidoreductase